MNPEDEFNAAPDAEAEFDAAPDAGVPKKAPRTAADREKTRREAQARADAGPVRQGYAKEGPGVGKTISLAGSGLLDSLGNADAQSLVDTLSSMGSQAVGGDDAADKILSFLGSAKDSIGTDNDLTDTYNARLAQNRADTEARNERSPFATQIAAPLLLAGVGAAGGGANAAGNAARQGLGAAAKLVAKGAGMGGVLGAGGALANMEGATSDNADMTNYLAWQGAKSGAKLGGTLSALGAGGQALRQRSLPARAAPIDLTAPTLEALQNQFERGVPLDIGGPNPAGTWGEAAQAARQELGAGVHGAIDSALSAGSEVGAAGRLVQGGLRAIPAALRAGIRARQGFQSGNRAQPGGGAIRATPENVAGADALWPGLEGDPYVNPYTPGSEYVAAGPTVKATPWGAAAPDAPWPGLEDPPYVNPFTSAFDPAVPGAHTPGVRSPIFGPQPRPFRGMTEDPVGPRHLEPQGEAESAGYGEIELPALQEPGPGLAVPGLQGNGPPPSPEAPSLGNVPLAEGGSAPALQGEAFDAWRAKHGSPQQPLSLLEPQTGLDWNSPRVNAAMGTAAELAITRGVMNPRVMLQYLRPYGIQTVEEAQAIMSRALRD